MNETDKGCTIQSSVHRGGDGILEIETSPGFTASITVLAGLTPEPDRMLPLISRGSGRRTRLTGLPADRRYYFCLAENGRSGPVVAERRVPLTTTVNFRDLGGYATRDGRIFKWGKVFRSDALSRLNESDLCYLRNIGMKLVIDLRSTDEAAKAPDLVPTDSGIRYLHLPIQTGEMNFVTAMEKMKLGDASWLTRDYMLKGYIRNLDEYGHVWGEVIKAVLEPANHPLVFHCTGGKDRAGTCAALLLLALGVPEETVVGDHQLSNVYIADLLEIIFQRIEAYGIDRNDVMPYFTAPEDCIQALLEHLRTCYGGVENYLTQNAGLSPEMLERLKDTLLD